MAELTDWLDLDEAKAILKIATTTSAKDKAVAAVVTAASARLDEAVGPVVVRTLTNELHDGGHTSLELEYRPVSTVTTVTEYDSTTSTTLTAETNSTKPTSGYHVDLEEGKLIRRNGNATAAFAGGIKNIDVTYVAGRYATTDVVTEFYKEGCRIFILNLWRSRQDGVGQVDEYDVPRANFPTFAIPNAVRQHLAPVWRERTVGFA